MAGVEESEGWGSGNGEGWCWGTERAGGRGMARQGQESGKEWKSWQERGGVERAGEGEEQRR